MNPYEPPVAPSAPIAPLADDWRTAYDSVFWLTYLANASLMVAVSMLFRYSDFVKQAGGSPIRLGLIVGIGMLGSLAMRTLQGVGIDRFGPRRVWLVSLTMFIGSMAAHMAITSVDNPAVFIARNIMTTSLAGAFGASITFISLRVPQNRMAEMIGMLGTSGFVGMALGPALGDVLFSGPEITRAHVQRMFLLAAVAGGLSLFFAALATRGHLRRRLSRQPWPATLVRRYHPGVLLLVSAAMGLGISLPGTFLRPYAESQGIEGIRVYFFVYAATAFLVRIATGRMPERIGDRPMILLGLGSLTASMLMYLVVRDQWTLASPALLAGIAHAFLFPSVIAGGSSTFPSRYRGLATTLMLALFDVGNLVGLPLAGFTVEYSPSFGLPPYPTMFVVIAASFAVVGILYLIFGHGSASASPRRYVVGRSAGQEES